MRLTETVLALVRLLGGSVDGAVSGLAVVGRGTLTWDICGDKRGVYKALRSLVASFFVF